MRDDTGEAPLGVTVGEEALAHRDGLVVSAGAEGLAGSGEDADPP